MDEKKRMSKKRLSLRKTSVYRINSLKKYRNDDGISQECSNDQDTDSYNSDDATGKKKSFTRILQRFAEKTSMQGVGYINSSKRTYARILWVFLLIGCTLGMALHLYYLLSQFIQFPVLTKISLGFDRQKLPDVTICNVNPLKLSDIPLTSSRMQSFLLLLDSIIKRKTTTKSKTRSKRWVDYDDLNTTNYDDYVDYNGEYDYGFPSDKEIDKRGRLLDIFYNLLQAENRTTRLRIGHDINDMVVSCSIGRYTCQASDFDAFIDPYYGKCYTFKAPSYIVNRAGPEDGLSFVLFLDKEAYLPEITDGNGIRIQIHDQSTYPFPFAEGLFIPAGFESLISLRKVVLQRLDEPYGKCTEGNQYSQSYRFKYSRMLCLSLCQQQIIHQRCHCYHDEFTELFYLDEIENNVKICKSGSELRCMMETQAAHLESISDCDCLNPCRENLFVNTISNRNWPNKQYLNQLQQWACEVIPHKCINNTEKGDLYEEAMNFIKVKIYYEDLNYETVTENPEIENAQFASDFGGAVGLWIGLSFLSLFEIFQLLLECCDFAIFKYKNKKKQLQKRSRVKNQNNQVTFISKNPYGPASERTSDEYLNNFRSKN